MNRRASDHTKSIVSSIHYVFVDSIPTWNNQVTCIKSMFNKNSPIFLKYFRIPVKLINGNIISQKKIGKSNAALYISIIFENYGIHHAYNTSSSPLHATVYLMHIEDKVTFALEKLLHIHHTRVHFLVKKCNFSERKLF